MSSFAHDTMESDGRRVRRLKELRTLIRGGYYQIPTRQVADRIVGNLAVMATSGDGEVLRWGVGNASGLGRHLAEFLVNNGCDVRDVPPQRTSQRGHGRHEGKRALRK